MTRLRLLVVLGVGLTVCVILTPRPPRADHAKPVEQLQVVEVAPPPRAARPEPPPFALLARFGETRLRHPAPLQSLVFSRDRKTLATTTTTERVVRLWDVASARLVRELRVERDRTTSFSVFGFSPDGRKLLVTRHDPGGAPEYLGASLEWATVDAHLRGR